MKLSLRLQLMGISWFLAHPERYRYVFNNVNDLTNLKKRKGILFQAKFAFPYRLLWGRCE